jgi:hypothetical protein
LADKTNNSTRTFDAFEKIGLITPGAVVGLMLTLEWPPLRALLGEKGLSVGDLGLFVLLAYVLGHLVQALGNLIEKVVWFPAGQPTNWLRSPHQSIITDDQRAALGAAIARMEGTEHDIANINQKYWLAITTRMYGRIKVAGRSDRVNIANRAYGLSRGLAAAFLLWLAWYGFVHRYEYLAHLILVAALCSSIWRMRRAGIQYARALALDFIELPRP